MPARMETDNNVVTMTSTKLMPCRVFIRLRRRPRALPVDECESAFASAGCSPMGKASGDPLADNPDECDEIIEENFVISYESG